MAQKRRMQKWWYDTPKGRFVIEEIPGEPAAFRYVAFFEPRPFGARQELDHSDDPTQLALWLSDGSARAPFELGPDGRSTRVRLRELHISANLSMWSAIS